MADKTVLLHCPNQGIDKSVLSIDEAKEWISEERAFWRGLPNLNEDLVMGQSNWGSPNIIRHYDNALSAIEGALANNNLQPFRDYLNLAKTLDAVLGHGHMAKQITELVVREGDVAQRLVLLFSRGVVHMRPEVARELAPLRAALRYNPNIPPQMNVVAAETALAKAKSTEKAIVAAMAEFEKSIEDAKAAYDAFAEEKKKELTALETLYETHLLLQGPSKHWKRVEERAWRYAAGAFALFLLMILAPAIAIYANWTALSGYIDHVIDVTKGSLSIAALVVFTVPVLAYGWLLKHISRVFAQNLAVSSDAEHRRVMAITFLGLARRKSVGMSEQDRALILNALFRPAPTSPQDEGPPAGLLELLRR
ncbi:DUF6161 domain-containing protein [Rhizobium sp. S152]|uniref:DUF6161 domain-containing protein n=1 Tax=Rhizobium sp. S152 TaxID=3055038 RepID=UPI0025A9656E|nr:DUF6161 domain-containing protein [Rhizobium sp. S152]MDM9629767.1 DUF6161 domain-containing protein [Rhizobium sp. S152]